MVLYSVTYVNCKSTEHKSLYKAQYHRSTSGTGKQYEIKQNTIGICSLPLNPISLQRTTDKRGSVISSGMQAYRSGVVTRWMTKNYSLPPKQFVLGVFKTAEDSDTKCFTYRTHTGENYYILSRCLVIRQRVVLVRIISIRFNLINVKTNCTTIPREFL